MKTFTTIIMRTFLLALLVFTSQFVFGQAGVLNPNDPIVKYNKNSPPATPPFGQMAKWVKTDRVGFTTTSFKCYYYKGLAFRLKFPKSYQHGVADGKTYPVYVFFHGIGEKGTVYDNEYQLYHGGELHRDAVDNGNFDGFLLYPQASASSGFFGTAQYTYVKEIIENYLVPQVKADINRIIVDGLSGGGTATWDFTTNFPTYVAAALPISAASLAYRDHVQTLKFTPFWQFQGGLDTKPHPNTTQQVVDAYQNAGANFKYTIYPNDGHGCWYDAWAEPDYFPFMMRAHKANPWPLTGRTEFCPEDPINVTIGVTAGFSAYEWRKNGSLIQGATSNQIVVNSIGTYDCRIRRGATNWSVWSPIPVVIKLKTPTISPAITMVGLQSKVIPALDTTTGVLLQVPTGYASYLWQKEGSAATLSTTNALRATSAGDYKVKVTEQFGCSSAFSPLFTIVDANGPNKPEPATGLAVTTLSKTSLRLNWSDNPSPQFNETNYEIYQATQAGGPFTLIALTGANTESYTAIGLNSNTKYYYKVRAINATAGSASSNEANGTTDKDSQAPTTPGNLTVTGTTRNAIALKWDASSDDVAVTKYEIYVNGVYSYFTTGTTFLVYNLEAKKSYNLTVRAKDFAGNASSFSNQVTAQPLQNGLSYKYYTFEGTWNNLPDFGTLAPVATGIMPNVALTPRTQDDNFAFLWEGYLNVTTAGSYNFRTNSDDGSRLWIGSLNGTGSPYTFSGTPTVNNDGLHGGQNVNSNSINLSVGTYPIAIAFYEQTGGEAMTVSWKRGVLGSYATIPNSAFMDAAVNNGSAPTAPSALFANAVSYNRIDLNWTDNSNNETGFEIWRSTSASTGFGVIGTTSANVTSYIDSTLTGGTTYYYRIKSIGQYGESALVDNIITPQAKWQFNSAYTDASGNGKTLTATGSPTFDAADKKEGTHALKLNGSSQYVTTPTSGSFLQDGYTQKTIAFWMKPSSTTGNNKYIFDFGGNDDGIALRQDGANLVLGISSGNTNSNRKSFSVAYPGTGWNHIAVVYSTNTLRLYINGVETVGSITNLPFTSVGSTNNGSRIGSNNGTNAFNQTSSLALFAGWIDNFEMYNLAFSATDIGKLMNFTAPTQSFATTAALPAIPAAPTAFSATGTSTSAINVAWTDNGVNEDKYELYRSGNNNSNYVLLATLPANTNSYQDTALLANSVFYYKVRAINVGGPSAFAAEDSAKTANHVPALSPIALQYMRYGTQLQLNIQATDPDAEVLTVTSSNLPSFATFTPGASGAATLSFNPASITDQNTYSNIGITVTDEHGGTSTVSFNLIVNDNYNPDITGAANVSVNEKQTAQVNLAVTDQNVSDVLTWSFTGLPAFATPTTNSSSAQIALAPGYTDNGTYVVTARVEDGNNGFDTASFTITVNNVNPNKTVYLNLTDGTLTSPAPWNNTSKVPAANDNFANLKDATGATTPIGVQMINAWTGINNLGASTGNNSGVYPDNVLRSSYYTTGVQNVRVYGLDVNSKHNFTFLSSRVNPTVGVVSSFTIGAENVTLNAANNVANTVSISNVQAAVDGSVNITVQRVAGSSFAYLNSIVIQSVYDDGTAPAKPRSLAAQLQPNRVVLSWIDAAYNEASYEVYRATDLAGPYTLIGTGVADIQQYLDSSITGNKTFYYAVRALNTYGNSPYSDTVAVTTPNIAPALSGVADISMKTDQVVDLNITAADDAGETITLTASNLPSFATFTDNGNGTGVLHVAPGTTKGTFKNIVITATDNSDLSSNKQLTIKVADANLTTAYLNFNQNFPAAAPWNNFNAAPNAGVVLSNLKDADAVATGINVTLVDKWSGMSTIGEVTGDNSGIYPDDVIRTLYYESTTSTRTIKLSGLSASKKYNLVFFASRATYTSSLITRYSVGSQFVELDANGNTSKTVQLNGLSPDVNGEIAITVVKAASSPNAYLNAMEIQSYPYSGNPLAPANLKAVGVAKDKIKLDWTSSDNNITGYEVWRSTSANGTYAKVADVAGNVPTYTNTNLAATTVYYYKVRAVRSGVFSGYSNYAGASTVAYIVNLNYNDGTAAGPAQGNNWNNTNALVGAGFTLPNMINDQGQNTGLNMTVVRNFSGFNSVGSTTGNNSGIVPDNVMKSFFYVNFGDTASFRITGLNQAHVYNFSFFGSRVNPAPGVGVTTAYKIGSQIVTLDAANNTANLATITNIKPDADGSVLVTMYGIVQGGFGYLGALIIQGMPAVALDPSLNDGNQNASTANLRTTSGITALTDANVAATEPFIKATVYPNPFMDDITLKLNLAQRVDKLSVMVHDISGRIIYRKQFDNVPGGMWQQRIGMSGAGLNRGMYFLQVLIPGQKAEILKLMKR